MKAALAGRIKAIWVVAANPAKNRPQWSEIFERLEFLAVQDTRESHETAEYADLVLPAAGWGEKDGMLINCERRIGSMRKLKKSPGVSQSDFATFKMIAERWGCGQMFADWKSPETAFYILKRLSIGRPCDFSGISDYRMIEDQGMGFNGHVRSPTTSHRGELSGFGGCLATESFFVPTGVLVSRLGHSHEFHWPTSPSRRGLEHWQ